MRKIIFTMLLALLCSQGVGRAEWWPTLEVCVDKSSLIVKARAVIEKNKTISFEPSETWKGTYDPKIFTRTDDKGRYASKPGENGVVDVFDGQEVVLVFIPSDQITRGKLDHHSTAFPVRKGKVIYAETSDSLRQELTLAEFKRRILERVEQDNDLMAQINALSLEQLFFLRKKLDQRLEDLTEQERKKWTPLKVQKEPETPTILFQDKEVQHPK